jgi:hypothetical protein
MFDFFEIILFVFVDTKPNQTSQDETNNSDVEYDVFHFLFFFESVMIICHLLLR